MPTGYLAVIDGTEEREDNDHDGMWDAWEVVYFGDLTTAEARARIMIKTT